MTATGSGPVYTPGTFLARLDGDEQAALLALGRERSFPRGAILMYEGDPGEQVMILLAGRVKVTRADHDGREALLSIRDPGDVLGELSFVDGQPRVANVTALEPVRTLVLTSSVFRTHLEGTPRVAVALLEVLTRRFRDATGRLSTFAASDTIGRLAARLDELARRYGEPCAEGIEIGITLSRDELGAWTGASRAGLAKALQTLRELGWIETERRRIVVRDPEALRARSA